MPRPATRPHPHARRASAFALLLALLPALTIASQPRDAPAAVDALDQQIATRMQEGGMVGMAAMIVIDGQVRWTGSHGWADRERGIAFTPDTVMNIASISKTVTGAAMMRAVEDGLLELDRDINAYLPFAVTNPAFPDVPITLRQLATHTSSLEDRGDAYATGYHYGGDSPVTLAAFLADYFDATTGADPARNFAPHAPGTHHAYSNIGAALAGYIVERATGEPLPDYTRRVLFAPLGMDSTVWRLAEVPPERQARLYVRQMGLAIPLPWYGLATYPDGGVRSSVNDLGRFFLALLGGGAHDGRRILGEASAREMLRLQFDAAHHPANLDPASRNSGLFWSTKLGATLVGHGGSDPGLKTEMLFDPAEGVGIVLFTNTSVCGDGMKPFVDLLGDLRSYARSLKGPPPVQ